LASDPIGHEQEIGIEGVYILGAEFKVCENEVAPMWHHSMRNFHPLNFFFKKNLRILVGMEAPIFKATGRNAQCSTQSCSIIYIMGINFMYDLNFLSIISLIHHLLHNFDTS
jgi:hypothetical protein